MKKIFSLLFIVGVMLSTGCKKYLDIKPKGYTIPEFYEDYAKLLNNASLYRVSSAYPNYLTDDVQAGEVKDPNKAADYPLYALFKRNMYEFKGGAIFEPGESDRFYEPAYEHIYVYNTVINNIEKVPDGSAADKKQLKAEAQIGRAFEYLTLVNAYAEHYDPATATTALGVPLVSSEDINVKYKRNTIAEVYEFIKKDLDEALPNLGNTAAHSFRPTKSVGYAFLSKMYLYMGKYDEALKNANEALKLNNALIDYSIYTNKKGTWGRVCTIADQSVLFPDADKSKESVWTRLTASSYGHVFAEVYASTDLLDVYRKSIPAGATDQRLKLFFCDGQANFGAAMTLFPGRFLWAPYIEFNMGFSTPELYLIAAECEARVGSKELALEHIDKLRNMRIVGNKPLVASTNNEALELVLDERRREMPYMGITRLVDLKRLNKDSRFAKTITHKNGTQTYTLAPNDKRYILPLPPKVLEYNPSIPVYER
ncbi:RagB/SusD family nutrient uptake outer membrane protein [Pedobacter frigoris]|uniref:RagB/SusD family nutrient uptake outer membrane protein n=1 Tax=Pedobacter frigoris TaxID=2571272 RepID=A0A4U1CEV6_9SPHI|nr:RagB/SusD family nutrient uptake outer membrane protein [Pedobacter frigoris]TKC05050.1 RagB/SusD family nutrient uptake outer membrane protein [Pedobacter frigoris]